MPDDGLDGPGLGVIGEKLTRLAADLRRTGEQLQRAIDDAEQHSCEATSPDGTVRIRANGRGRIDAVELSPALLRQDPDTLDDVLTATLREALLRARAQTRAALLETLPARQRAGAEQAMDDAGRDPRT